MIAAARGTGQILAGKRLKLANRGSRIIPVAIKLKKVLIANRGEIAVRVIRACHALGLRAVAVYSDADRWALHTRLADEAHRLGPPPASESYLNAERIIEIAEQTGCDAIHPGYGFLAENPRFAERVEESGLVFIGPPPEAMALMGNKLAARKTAKAQGVPTVLGVYEPVRTLDEALSAANEVGYPMLLKAAAGGGGVGMRLVQGEAELKASFERAVSEVEKSFGDPSVYLEKFIPKAKHIEVQIMADARGNVVHLYERECSVQRRYQKLIEETPALLLDEVKREEMGEAAVAIARACGYRSAGTVEFLYDVEQEKYCFLEMNTRIQVEHPITEMTTGVDLVGWQLLIAGGEPLPLSQSEILPRGAAIECRIYAEDPEHGFLPSTGVIEELLWPSGPGVRVDHGIERGDEITPHYDPLLAKLIAWGEDRPQALARMRQALEETLIAGVATTVGFHLDALTDERFLQGTYTTDFARALTPRSLTGEERTALAVAAALKREEQAQELRRALSAAAREQEARWKWAQP
jgi:acetyl-CoA carboxylase biotin carboxylase subunit